MSVDASKDQKPDIIRFRGSTPRAPRAGRWTRELNASTAQCATAPAMSSPGSRIILDRPLSTVPGHWSTTKGTSVSTMFSTL